MTLKKLLEFIEIYDDELKDSVIEVLNTMRQEYNIALQERDSIITEQRKLIDVLEEYNNKLKDKLGDSSNFQGNR